jgi:putative flippase GtrA
MAPTAYHRIRFRQRDKERMLRWANRFAIAGVCLLAVAIGTIVLLVIDVLYELRVAAAVAGTLTGLIAWTWFALPLSRQVAEDLSDA